MFAGGSGGLVSRLCLTLCHPMDCSRPGYSAHGILQTRILEWAAISFSRQSSRFRVDLGPPALQVVSLPLSHQESLCVCVWFYAI